MKGTLFSMGRKGMLLGSAGLALLSPLLASAPALAATRYETGIATSATLPWMKEADLDTRFAGIKRLGASWVRVDFSWPLVQPRDAHSYRWEQYDRVVKAASRHDIKILGMLAYTPQWAREPRCAAIAGNENAAQKCNPANIDTFAQFAADASFRYRGQSVRAWEIWNEPNLSGYWKTAQPDGKLFVNPILYARLANAAALQIRHHDPGAIILTGGLAPMFEPRYPIGMRQSDYLEKLLPQLHHNLFDAVAVHPYTWPILPSKKANYNAFFTVDQGRPRHNLRVVMDHAGWGDKQVWGTEYGASTKGKRRVATPDKRLRPDHVTEEKQAQIIKQGVERWYRKADVGPLFVHSDGDQWLAGRKNENGFGLKRSDGSPKPAYDAFRAAALELRRTQASGK